MGLPRMPDNTAEDEGSRDRPEPLVTAAGLIKDFGSLRAVDTVDFDVLPRDFLGFLGPNGAGKTTIMKMMY